MSEKNTATKFRTENQLYSIMHILKVYKCLEHLSLVQLRFIESNLKILAICAVDDYTANISSIQSELKDSIREMEILEIEIVKNDNHE